MAVLRRGVVALLATLAITTSVVAPVRAQDPEGTDAEPTVEELSPTAESASAEAVPLYPAARDVRAAILPNDLPTDARPVDYRSTHSFSIAAGDLNGDNRPDLVFGLHSRIRGYLNLPTGLQRVLMHNGGDSHGCDIGDVNADDRGDVYCVLGGAHGNGTKKNPLFIQGDLGGFTNQSIAWGPTDPYGRGRHTQFADLNSDDRPDIFVGNEYPREDGRQTPNRTYINTSATLVKRSIGATREIGGLCVERVDQNMDHRDDVLVCGGRGRATPNQPVNVNDRLHLYRQVRLAGGTTELRNVAPSLGINIPFVQSAAMARLDNNRSLDLVIVTPTRVEIAFGRNGGFGRRLIRPLTAGRWVATGRFDAGTSQDIIVVQGCTRRPNGTLANQPDFVLLGVRNRPGQFVTRRLPNAAGCGDTAEAVDLDRDGRMEFLVGNGQWDAEGPVQVFTTGNLGESAVIPPAEALPDSPDPPSRFGDPNH
jgi:hypothetical protein